MIVVKYLLKIMREEKMDKQFVNTVLIPYSSVSKASQPHHKLQCTLNLAVEQANKLSVHASEMHWGLLSAFILLSGILTEENTRTIYFLTCYGGKFIGKQCQLYCVLKNSLNETMQHVRKRINEAKPVAWNDQFSADGKTLFYMAESDGLTESILNKNWDLVIDLSQLQSLKIHIYYDQSRYEEEYISAIMNFYLRLVDWVLDNTDTPVLQWTGYGPVLSGELQPFDKVPLISDIEAACTRFTYRVACEFQDEMMTYQELSIRSGYLARWLIQHGYGAQKVIGMYLDKSMDVLVTMLAVMKAGAICMPVDKRHPLRVVNQFVLSGGCVLLITDEVIEGIVTDTVTISDIKKDIERIGLPSDTEYPSVCESGNRFLIYTTGSSGEAKGILLNDWGVKNHLLTKIKLLNLTESDCLVHGISIGFVASLWLLMTPLLVGAKIMLMPDDLTAQMHMQIYDDKNVTVLTAVPTVWNAMLKSKNMQSFTNQSLRWVISTGEELDCALLQKIQHFFPTAQVMNAYGQTECSDDTLHYIVNEFCRGQTVPLGLPAMNTTVYIAGSSGIILPQGVVGNIIIESPGVSKSAECFFTGNRQTDLPAFNTRDLGYINQKGEVVFVSRASQAIKVNGCKISTSYIRQVVLKHSMVQDVAVCIVNIDAYRQAITVFYEPMAHIDEIGIREHVAQMLPWYMQPHQYIRVEAIPKLINGKYNYSLLNQKALENLNEHKSIMEKLAFNKDWINYGGDSLALAILTARLRNAHDMTDKELIDDHRKDFDESMGTGKSPI